MIDDKKIKSAAQGYCDATYGTIDDSPFITEAFRKGAKLAINEFLNDLWHPNTEEPDKRKSDIITIGSYNYISIHLKESFIWKEESWKYSISRCQITKWAYLSDILPKKERR
nr:MAG: hypothetical protein [Bacteriophage sp.]